MTSPATARTRRRPSCGLNIALPPEDSSRVNAFSEREADKWVARGAAFFEPGPQTVRTMGGLRAEDREVFSVPTSPEGRGERRLRVGVSVQVTGGEAAWLDLLPFRLLAAALRHHSRTARMETSRADTGSSRKMNFGVPTRARAMAMRCRWPPLNSWG